MVQIKNKYLRLKALLFFCFIPLIQYGQTTFQPSDKSLIKISGTSTLHDWEMSTSYIKGDVVFLLNESGYPEQLQSLQLRINVMTLKSDKSKLDENAYEALNAKLHPVISFSFLSGEIIQLKDNKQHIKAKGTLSVSGVTKEKLIEAICEKDAQNNLICYGKITLKMTEFNVKPPVFMLGAMKTGDEITVSYKIIFKG